MLPLVIVVGTGRSGTSTMWRIFLNTFSYAMAYEPRFVIPYSRKQHGDLTQPTNQRRLLERIAPELNHEIDWDFDAAVRGVASPDYGGVVLAGLRFIASVQSKSGIGWKDPSDSYHMRDLAKLFPTAKFVHIMRNAHDVAASLVSRTWGPTNLYTGGLYWSRTIEEIWRAKESLTGRFHEVRFEDLFERPEPTAEALANFIDSPMAPKLVNYIQRRREADRIMAWKRNMSRDGRRLVEAAAQQTLIKAGYDTEFQGQAKISSAEAGWLVATDFCRRGARRARRKLTADTAS